MPIKIIRELNADVVKRGATRAIYAKQNDVNSRFLNVRIQEDGTDIVVAPTLSVFLNVVRSDKAKNMFSGSVNDDGSVKVPLTSWMLELEGTLICDISIVSEDPNVAKLTTMQFNIYVEAAAVSDGDIVDAEEYSVIVNLINDAEQALQRAKDNENRINEMYDAWKEAVDSASVKSIGRVCAYLEKREGVNYLFGEPLPEQGSNGMLDLKMTKEVYDLVRKANLVRVTCGGIRQGFPVIAINGYDAVSLTRNTNKVVAFSCNYGASIDLEPWGEEFDSTFNYKMHFKSAHYTLTSTEQSFIDLEFFAIGNIVSSEGGTTDPNNTLAMQIAKNADKIVQHTYSIQEIKNVLSMQDSNIVSYVGNNEDIELPHESYYDGSGGVIYVEPRCARYGRFIKLGGASAYTTDWQSSESWLTPGYISKIVLRRGYQWVTVFEMPDELLSRLPNYGVAGNEILFGDDGHIYYRQTAEFCQEYSPVDNDYGCTTYGYVKKLEEPVVIDITEYMNWDGWVDIWGEDNDPDYLDFSGETLSITVTTVYTHKHDVDYNNEERYSFDEMPAYTEFYCEKL